MSFTLLLVTDDSSTNESGDKISVLTGPSAVDEIRQQNHVLIPRDPPGGHAAGRFLSFCRNAFYHVTPNRVIGNRQKKRTSTSVRTTAQNKEPNGDETCGNERTTSHDFTL